MLVTNRTIEYKARAPFLCTIAVIPEGTPVIPATNLPSDEGQRYWAEPWEGMSEDAEGWQRNYGFLIDDEDVEVLFLEE